MFVFNSYSVLSTWGFIIEMFDIGMQILEKNACVSQIGLAMWGLTDDREGYRFLSEILKEKKEGKGFGEGDLVLEHDKTMSLIHDLKLIKITSSHNTLLKENTKSDHQYHWDILKAPC